MSWLRTGSTPTDACLKSCLLLLLPTCSPGEQNGRMPFSVPYGQNGGKYHDGIRVLDISGPSNPRESAGRYSGAVSSILTRLQELVRGNVMTSGSADRSSYYRTVLPRSPVTTSVPKVWAPSTNGL